jgi:hypothetical protein
MLTKARRQRATAHLQDPSQAVRLNALNILAQDDDPYLVDEILPLARDPDEAVRCRALSVLAAFDDRRVLSELMSALDDVSQQVRKTAEDILNSRNGPVPSLARVAGEREGRAVWRQLRATAEKVIHWGSELGQELLGKSVAVRRYYSGLGRTRAAHVLDKVEVEVSEAPVTSGHPHGEDIMRGLVLHEIGHHLADIGVRGHKTTRGIARSEGIDIIYDILCDERLERKLRSRRPQWGIYFDRLAAYAFAQDVHRVPLKEYARLAQSTPKAVLQAIQRGHLPGRLVPSLRAGRTPVVILREKDILTIPNAVPPLTAFLSCLRGGFDPHLHPNPCVAAAMAQVPRNLKDLSHGELLRLARQIAEILWGTAPRGDEKEQLQQRLREFPHALRGLQRMLERMERIGRLPDALKSSMPPPIRQDTPVPAPTGSDFSSPSSSSSGTLNLNPEQDFPPLTKEHTLPYEPERYAEVVARIRQHTRRLRSYLEQLSTRTLEEYATRRGQRLDLAQARKIAYHSTPNLLVFSHEERHPDLYLGVLIDRSSSMKGERLESAKAFAVLVAESAKGISGIEGHITAFDGEAFYLLGDFHRTSVTSLTADDGNNDAGALARAAELALRSRKRNKLLVMISDGAPAQCTFASLQNLVARLTRDHRIRCAQVAVAALGAVAFPHYVDVSRYSMDEAVARFGNLLLRLTTPWR